MQLASNVEESARGMAADGKTKVPVGEFQHQLFAFVSLNDSDHGSVVRIFVGHS